MSASVPSGSPESPPPVDTPAAPDSSASRTIDSLTPTPVIGVLALQGAFAEHVRALDRLGVASREVRLPADLDGLAGLIVPGGESTTIGKLLDRTGLLDAIRQQATAEALPVWGTCAGLIVLARDIGDSGSRVGSPQPLLGLMDLQVRRNAFGTQLDSFETDLSAPAVADRPLPAVFIRAPVIEATGDRVEVLARLPDGRPVAAREGRFLVTAFHPELTDDLAFHRYFVEVVAAEAVTMACRSA
ncbi:MAG: pyridoxal 5'-phosphate synthase glutaminase subunit PdxT [Chloroflexota bacterium]|nr:pyridoxal 5'-phosphate synthase glutaminase subunit PdxT [Chloroflexota bacterium]